MADRLPWFPFETVAWRGDLQLKSCSLAAREVWLEMLTIMHEAEPRGYLLLNGLPVTHKQLAKFIGAKVREVERCVIELGEGKVYSRTEDGVIYSRKMVRDSTRRESDRERQQRKRDKDRDNSRDVTPDVTRDSASDTTDHVTPTGARGIARQSFRDQKDQEQEHRAQSGAGCAQPVEKPDPNYGRHPAEDVPSHDHLQAVIAGVLDDPAMAFKSEGDVLECAKGVAARAGLAYSGRSMAKAFDAVMAAAAKKARRSA